MVLIIAHKRVRIFIAIFFFYFLLVMPDSSCPAQEPLTVQVYPYAPASRVLKQFTPLSNYLKQTLDREVTIRISKDHNDHLETVGNDRADVAFLGPSSYVKIVEAFGKKPVIARIEVNGSPLLQGVIFTSSSSQLASLKDLKGKRFAFGYQNSTMSHLVPIYMLQQEGIHVNDLAQYTFLNDQYNVALGVLMGDFDAGAVNVSVFQKYKGRGLKELARSPKVSEHLFVARASLPEDTVTALKRAFLDVQKDKNAQIIMSSIRKDMTAFVPASDRDYGNLRMLLQSIDKSKTAP
jgi:phosphonate transport system substrate-binding protein